MGVYRSGRTMLVAVVAATALLIALMAWQMNPAPLRAAFTPAEQQQ